MIFQLPKFALGRLSFYAARTKVLPAQLDIAQSTEEAAAAFACCDRPLCGMKKTITLIGGKNGFTGHSRSSFSKECRKGIDNDLGPALGTYRLN
jgi:hypothetical protein